MQGIQIAVLALGFVAAAAPATAQDATLYLEAERFDDVGGWTVDAQFRQLMGSTYLLAAGIGEPVADAVTRARLPRAGTYHLWVRCKDWHETSPGAFQVLVNDRPCRVTFGTQKKDWSWVSGGAFELPAGEATLRLRDLTGYYGRCDALLLTTDAQFTPSGDQEGIARLRERLLGRREPQTLDFDFVVVGGGYGGVCSAVQAARLGLKTALIQNRPVLGGNASSEVNVGPGGASPHTSRFRETGIPEEIAEGRFRRDHDSWSDAIDLLIRDVPNLTVYLNTEGTRPVMEGKARIAAVEAENVITGQRTLFRAPLFADCTGDGAIAFAAGCEFRVGQEDRDEFGESYAPEQPNRETMGTSMIHRSTRMGTPQPFTPPAFAVKFTAEHFVKRKTNLVNGSWWIEYGGLKDTIRDAEHIRDELIRVIFGAFDWAKNRDPETRDKVTHHKLTWVPTVGGKRESRRFIGDTILTQGDVESGRLFPDRVAFGGWPIDLHPAPGIYGKEIPPYTPFHLKQPYSIPYRILYPKGVENLFLAGRHVSVTHVALGSTRLMQTIGTMGQAVGAAAYLCRKHATTPRGIYPGHIGELQQLLLKWDAYLPEVKSEDPGDLCRGARVTASSTCPAVVVSAGGREPLMDKDAPCTMIRGQSVAVVEPGRKSVSLYLRAAGATEAELRVERVLAEEKTEPLWVVKAPVAAGAFRWVEFALPETLTPGQEYRVWLSANPQLTWKIFEGSGGDRFYGRPGTWTKMHGSYAIRPFGTPVRLGSAGPSAAVDGLKWPDPDEYHQWRSDPAQGLPQWLEVDFGRPVALNTLYLTFDTNIFGRFPRATPEAEVTAQDYRLLYAEPGGRGTEPGGQGSVRAGAEPGGRGSVRAEAGVEWKEAFAEKGNWRRFRRHAFPAITTSRIRLDVLSARNGNEARVYEIRAYKE